MSNKLIDIIVTTENDTMNQTESQRNRIKAILEDGRSINPLDAFKDVGTMKLSTRVSELIKEGYPVKKEWMNVTNRFGETVKVMRYSKG